MGLLQVTFANFTMHLPSPLATNSTFFDHSYWYIDDGAQDNTKVPGKLEDHSSLLRSCP